MIVAVADTGNISRAAEVVHRSQSAVSMQIKTLERALGKPLFVRGPRSVAPTQDGEVLLAYVTPEFRFRGVTSTLLDEMERHAKAQHADRMSLTTTETARAFFMARGYTPEEEAGDLFSEDQCTLLKEWRKE